MRHRHSGRQLNRNSSHRKAMFRNMTVSLVEHELIKTIVLISSCSTRDTVMLRNMAFRCELLRFSCRPL